MKIISIVGARPQFIKLAPISRALNKFQGQVSHIIIHTGQHYDENMSGNFFSELQLPEPNYNLSVGSGTHAEQTGRALERIEKILINENPDHVIVFGDTNSTLSGVLAASKLNIPISHIEAGLRSYNRIMPEEINRIIADKLSTYLFCPDKQSVINLAKEGIYKGVYNVGDVMVDQIKYIHHAHVDYLLKGSYIYMTLHRQETVNNFDKLVPIILELNKIADTIPIIFAVHPRVVNLIKSISLEFNKNFSLVNPLGYKESICHIKNASCIITDSGGMQKESYILKTPCITLRTETEWVDTLYNGWNTLTAFNLDDFRVAFNNAINFDKTVLHPNCYGCGDAAPKIINSILQICCDQKNQ